MTLEDLYGAILPNQKYLLEIVTPKGNITRVFGAMDLMTFMWEKHINKAQVYIVEALNNAELYIKIITRKRDIL